MSVSMSPVAIFSCCVRIRWDNTLSETAHVSLLHCWAREGGVEALHRQRNQGANVTTTEAKYSSQESNNSPP